MKFNQYTWNLYKQSPDGQKAIKEFEEANEKMTEYDLFANNHKDIYKMKTSSK